jgi:hypothetical protein
MISILPKNGGMAQETIIMNKGKVIAFRLSDTLHRDLLQMAEIQGCTISDVARNIITEHFQGEHLLRALEENRKVLSREIAQIKEELSKMRTATGDTEADKPGSESFAAYKSRVGR